MQTSLFYRLASIGVFWLCFAFVSLGQMYFIIDDTLQLDVFTVKTSRQKTFDVGTSTINADSLLLMHTNNENIGSVLQSLAPLNIRDKGTSGLISTFSLRGAGGSRTLLTWNNIPLNSLTSGDVNLSLINGAAFNDININYSAPATLYGSNAFGGVVNLNNKAEFNKGFGASLTQYIGAFNTLRTSAVVNYSNADISLQVQVWQNSSDNNFEYFDTYFGEILKRSNAKQSNNGLIANASYRLHNLQLDAGVWAQKNNTGIPDLNGNHPSQKLQLQYDESFRAYSSGQYSSGKLYTNVNLYHTYDWLHFLSKNDRSQDEWGINSEIETTMSALNADVRYNFCHWLKADVGGNLKYSRAGGSNFAQNPDETHLALFSAFKLSYSILNAVVSARKEFHTYYNPPFLWGAGANIKPLTGLTLRAAANKKFRTPTFNDKFWPGSGVLNIKPEEGMSYEGGVDLKVSKIKTSATAYLNNMESMIVWQDVGGGIWKPINLDNVKSYGLETRAEWNLEIVEEFKLKLNGSFDINRSYRVTDPDKRQLTYTPKYRANMGATLSYAQLSAMFNFLYLSRRNYDAISNKTLPEYYQSSLNLIYRIDTDLIDISVSLKINNLFDNDEPYYRKYPIPGRHIIGGIKLII